MTFVFLDTNVLIDFLSNRQPFALEAAKLFNYALNKKIKIYISAVSYNNIYYILRQSNTHTQTMNLLSELSEWTETIDVTKEIIKKSMKADFKDFEDSIQYHCAKSNHKIAFIVTRDTKDFKLSSLPVLTPEEATTFIQNS